MKTAYEAKWEKSEEGFKNCAQLSECGNYRWFFSSETGFKGPERRMIFKMINPSTASHEVDDATVRSCRRIAAANNCTEFCILNFFPFRSPDVEDVDKWFMKTGIQESFDVLGCNHILVNMALAGAKAKPNEIIFVLACGNFNKVKELKHSFQQFLDNAKGSPIYCLGRNKDGSPKHPLFLKASTPLIKFEVSG